MTTPRCGLIYHFSHLDNLRDIVSAGALLCDRIVHGGRYLTTEAGDLEIKDRRRRQPVTCDPGGCVGDYVPFYFAARSPMAYKLSRGSVPTFLGSESDLVYFVSSVETVVDADLPFAISDRNAAKSLASFTSDVGVLGDLSLSNPRSSFIDWPLMRSQMWSNTQGDPERMERRMAEFLVYDRFPLEYVGKLAVRSESHRARVERVFAGTHLGDEVVVRSDFYYT